MGSKAKRRLAVIALLMVAAVAVGVGVINPRLGGADKSSVATTAITTGDLSVSVTGSGRVVDRYTYSLAPGSSPVLVEQAGQGVGTAANAVGYRTVRLDVSSGEHVAKAQKLALVKDAAGTTTAVKTPVSGYVRSVTTAKAAATNQVATIGAGGQLASVTVSEYDVAKVKIGQKVSVTLSALDEELTGNVESIGQTADDSSGVQQYQVLIALNDLPAKTKIGMSVTAEIATASKQDVLLAPAAAITETGGRSTVEVLQPDGTTQVVTVEIGLVGASQVEILSGLQVGDEVVTGTQGTVPASSFDAGFPGGGPPGGA